MTKTDLSIEGNYLRILQERETPDRKGVSPVMGYYPIHNTCISFRMSAPIDSKSGKQQYKPEAIIVHNIALNTSCEITEDEVNAGMVTQNGKTAFTLFFELINYLARRTSAPIDDESTEIPPIATPIKSR